MEHDGVECDSNSNCPTGAGDQQQQQQQQRRQQQHHRARQAGGRSGARVDCGGNVDAAAAELKQEIAPVDVVGAPDSETVTVPVTAAAVAAATDTHVQPSIVLVTDAGKVIAQIVDAFELGAASDAFRCLRVSQQQQRRQQERGAAGAAGSGARILSDGASSSAYDQVEAWPTGVVDVVDNSTAPWYVAMPPPPDSAASGKLTTATTAPSVHTSLSHKNTDHGELLAFGTTDTPVRGSHGLAFTVDVPDDFSRAKPELEDSTPKRELMPAKESRKKRPRRRGREVSATHPLGVDSETLRKERNRRAQRSFRERQKKRISDASTNLKELREKIHHLEVENAKIKKENEMLRCYVEQFGILLPQNSSD